MTDPRPRAEPSWTGRRAGQHAQWSGAETGGACNWLSLSASPPPKTRSMNQRP